MDDAMMFRVNNFSHTDLQGHDLSEISQGRNRFSLISWVRSVSIQSGSFPTPSFPLHLSYLSSNLSLDLFCSLFSQCWMCAFWARKKLELGSHNVMDTYVTIDSNHVSAALFYWFSILCMLLLSTNNEGVQRPDAWNQIKTWPCANDVVFVL